MKRTPPDPALVAFQDGALLTGGAGPRSAPSVVAAAGEQVPAVHGDRAHRVDPALVALQDGALLPVAGSQIRTVAVVAAAGQQVPAADAE